MSAREYFFGSRVWTDEDISAAQTAHATKLRIPLLRHSCPTWQFITGIVVGSDSVLDMGVMPTKAEVGLLAARLNEYNKRWYGQGRYRTAMREFAPYDIDGQANLGYFIKLTNSQWAFRKKTWNRGPHWMPLATDEPHTLQEVIDRFTR